MDLQEYVNHFEGNTCILSIEKKSDGGYGKICIEVGNEDYLKTYVTDEAGILGDNADHSGFVPGSEYTRYIPKDINFERFVYDCAILKKPMHAYVHTERFDNAWFNMYSLPVAFEDPNKCYCTYTLEMSKEADPDQMTNLSRRTTAEVLKTCIKLRSTKNFLKSMDEVIADIRQICNASFCCVLLTDFEERSCSLLSESFLPGSGQTSLKNFLNDQFIDFAQTWLDIIDGSNCLIISNPSEMDEARRRNPSWHRSLQRAAVNSLVLFPLRYNEKCIGFIWVTNFDTRETEHIKETLELSTYFIASEIANYQLLQRLEMLSSIDLLTNVKNRNAMNNRVISLISGRERAPSSMGVIFADLNGLKAVNDEQGHVAGDCLLKEAAFILKNTFAGCEVYRAGGDEFVVIAMDQPKERIEDLVEKLRKDSDDPNSVSFALGFYYDDKGGDIRLAMREADALMYLDKRRFYDRFPETRRF